MDDAVIYPVASPRFVTYHAAQVHGGVFLTDFLQLDPANVWLSPDKQGG